MKVLLLPGLLGSPAEFGELAPLLPGARALRLPTGRADTLRAIARQLADAADVDVDVIIGASFGGLVARALVGEGISRARLVLIGTLPHPKTPPVARRCALPARISVARGCHRKVYHGDHGNTE